MKKEFCLFVALIFLVSNLAISNVGYNKKIDGKSVKTYLFFPNKNEKCNNLLQPMVIITSPQDGAILHTRDVSVIGYATDEAGMNYWEWEWHWKGGYKSNSSYFETAQYVEFRIDIHGLALGWNLIIVRFRNIYGVYGEDAVNITYEDIYPPNVDILDPPDGSIFTEPNIIVKVHADDGYGTPQWGSGVKKISWTHSWEDGEEEGSHIFDKPHDIVSLNIPITLKNGENVIEVTAEDEAGNSAYPDTITVTLIQPLVAEADGPYYGDVNEEIQFKGNASGGLPPYEWQWDFGDGSTSNEQNPKHSYSNEGNYTATLTVKDSLGNTAQDTANVIISKKLRAEADGPYYGEVNKKIQFKGNASGGSPPYQWHWDFGDGSTSNEQNPKHSYSKEGNYVVKLTVTDSEGNKANDTAQVTVYKELKAEANGPYGGFVGNNIHFIGSASGGVPPYQWHWNFGDGNVANQQNPVHSYSMPGVYTATLTVRDSIGNVAGDSAFVYIFTQDNTPPSIKIVKPDRGLYMNDRKLITLPLNISIVIGKTTVEVEASDNIAIAKVEFYMDDELKHTNYTAPYYWELNETIFGLHELKAVAYDFVGQTAEDDEKMVIVIKP